jgi:protein arginine kinase activator
VLCQNCRKSPATVKVTTLINDQKTETHLCQDCARKSSEFGLIEPGLTIQQLLANLLSQQLGGEIVIGQTGPLTAGQPQTERPAPVVACCPTCGMTFEHFRKVGRLGCGECYRAFDQLLEPLLKRIHGGHLHRGKEPSRAEAGLRQRREIAQAKEQMLLAVAKEDFERAAMLRDRIRDMEKTGAAARVKGESADALG